MKKHQLLLCSMNPITSSYMEKSLGGMQGTSFFSEFFLFLLFLSQLSLSYSLPQTIPLTKSIVFDINQFIVSENTCTFAPGISLIKKIVAMKLPEEPMMLYSFINTKLRDSYPSLDALCEDMNVDKGFIISTLKRVGFEYSPERNRFW